MDGWVGGWVGGWVDGWHCVNLSQVHLAWQGLLALLVFWKFLQSVKAGNCTFLGCVVVVAARWFCRLLCPCSPALGRHPQATAAIRNWRSRGWRGALAVGWRADLPQRRLLWSDDIHCVWLRHRPPHLPRICPRLRPIYRWRAYASDKRVCEQRGAVWYQHCRQAVPGTGVLVPSPSAVCRRRKLVTDSLRFI